MNTAQSEKSNKFMDWLQYKFAPAVENFMTKPWIAGFSEGVIKCLPFILTGALVFFYEAVASWVSFLPTITFVRTYTFQLLGVLVAYNITAQTMMHLRHRNYSTVAGLTAVCANIMAINGQTNEAGLWEITYSRLGPSGILLSMVIAVYVSIVFHLVSKIRFFKPDSAMPTFVQDWVKNIVPIFITILLLGIVVINYQVDLLPIILTVFNPLLNIAQTFPGWILHNTLMAMFYGLGVSGWTFSGINNAISIPAQDANLAALAANQIPQFINVTEIRSGIGLVNMGGIGATLALNVMFLFSKSKRLKTLGKVCIGPGLFSINEPILFGAPMVCNPIFLIPMVVSAIVGSTIVWFIFKLGLLAYPNVALAGVGTLPVIAGTVMLTGDFRGILWWFVLFAIYGLIYYPFFKVYEKQELEKEAEEKNKSLGQSEPMTASSMD
jgi:PTS system cellobiose-specific IIC component